MFFGLFAADANAAADYVENFGTSSFIQASENEINQYKKLNVINAPAPTPAFVSQERLVGYWKLDEISGSIAADSSGNNNGILINNPMRVAGKINNALRFNGISNFVDLGTSSLLRPAGDMTVSAWVNINQISGTRGIVGGRGAGNDYQMPYGLRYADNFSFNLGEGNNVAIAAGGTVVLGEWAHIAGTVSGNNLSLYKDGVLAGSAIFSGIRQSGSMIVIGADQPGAGFANGSIDEIKIYNRALSPSEILADYNAGIPTADITLPVINISSLVNNQEFLTPSIIVTGTASDNIALLRVEVKLNSGEFQIAAGTTSWSMPLTLTTIISGSNIITARATDTSGNIQETAISITYIPSNIAPSAPQNLVGEEKDNTISLAWLAPLSTGGSPITGYKVYRGATSGSETFLADSTALSYNDFTATGKIAYYYQVTAINSIGESLKSNEAIIIPQSVKTEETVSVPSGSSLYPDSTLLKSPDSFKVYVVIQGKKKWIPTPEVLETLGYQWTNITNVDINTLKSIPDYEDNLIRAVNDYKVYLVINGIKRHIPNPDIFLSYGFSWDDIKDVPQVTIDQYQDGYLIREPKQSAIYYLSPQGVKKWIPTPDIFNSYYNSWTNIQVVSKKEMDFYPTSNLIKFTDSSDIYLVEGTVKRFVPSLTVFNKYRYDWNLVSEVNQTEFEWYKQGNLVK